MKLTKGLMASIIIITISGLAFTAGFLRERVVTEIEEIKGTIANDEILVERIGSKISDILLFDFISTNDARNELKKSQELAIEYDILDENLTAEEKSIYNGRLKTSINKYENILLNSYLGQLIDHFDLASNEVDYYFATYVPFGYNYSITSDEFFDLDNSLGLYTIETKTEFLTQLKNSTFWEAELGLTYDEYIVPDSQDNWAILYRRKQSQIQQLIINNTQLLADLESEVSYYSYGVTAITVATILASAMATQLYNKRRERDFSHIKAKIYEDESMIITKIDRLAFPILILALALSILGLLLPFLIGLIT